jgi:hypothetical protein
VKTTYLMTAILVAALFLGTAVSAGIARNVSPTENNINATTSGATIQAQETTNTGVSAGRAPVIPSIPGKEDVPVGSIPVLMTGPFYASNVIPTPHTTFYFDSAAPGTVTQIGTYGSGSTDFLSGGTFDNNGIWWACQYSTTSSNIYTINKITGALTLIGASGHALSGISVDKTTGILYGIGGSSTTNQALYTIDMTTGVATLVGPCSTNTLFIDIAIDGSGNAYAIDLVADSLFSVNLATGATTLVGSCGISMNYAQDSCFDIDNNILYHAAYTSGPILYTINVATGAATLVGSFPSGYEVDCFAIPYTTIPADHDVGIKDIIQPSNGTVHIFTPNVQVKNYGNNTETNIPVNLKIDRKQVNGTSNDFETNDGGYTHQAGVGGTTPGTDAWEYGIPSASMPGAAHSGTKCWGTTLAGNYPNYMYGNLTTPSFVVPAEGYLEFWTWYSLENSYDGGNVKISNNSWATWTLLTPVGGYPGFMNSDPYMTGQAGYTGNYSTQGWRLAHFDLPASMVGQTVQIRFSAGSDSSVQYPGWFIDDVTIGYATYINEYNQTVSIASILSGQTLNLTTFPTWTPYGLGVTQNADVQYKMQARCNLTGDLNPDNDFKEKALGLHFGWLHDISVDKIVAPPLTGKAIAYIPKVNVSNIGQNSESSVPVRMKITKNQYTTLMNQPFTGTFPPTGWTQDNATEWTQSATVNAGGTSPEARLYWSNIIGNYAFLQSPAVATSTASILQLKFRSYLDVSGPIYAKVLVRPDNLTAWTDMTPWTNPVSVDIAKALYTIDISALKGTGTQVMFEFSGPYINIMNWYIDDVQFINKVATLEKDQTLYTSPAAGAKVQLTYTSWTPADLYLFENVDVEYEVNVTATLATDGYQANNKIIQFTILHYDWFNDVKVNGITKPISGLAQVQIPMVNMSNVGQKNQNVNVNMVIQKLAYTTYLTENFESTFPPAGWTVVIHQNTNAWQRNDYPWPSGTRPNLAGTGYCADADVDRFGSGGPFPMNTSLVSPAIDLSTVSHALLKYNAYYYVYNTDILKTEVSINNGSTWTAIKTVTGSYIYGLYEAVSLDLTPYCGNSQVKVRFHYYAPSWAYYWEVDDVSIVQVLTTTEYNNTVPTTINAYQTKNVTMPSWHPYDVPLGMNVDYLVTVNAVCMGYTSLWTNSFNYTPAIPPAFPPTGWTRIAHSGTLNWQINNYWTSPRTNYAGTGLCADADADKAGSGGPWPMNCSLMTPSIDLTGKTQANLTYHAYYYLLSSDYAKTEISTNGGVSWAPIYTKLGSFTGLETISLDLTPYCGNVIQIRFHYYSPAWDYYFEVDDVKVMADSVVMLSQNFDGTTIPATWNGWYSTIVSGTSTLKWSAVSTGSYPTCVPHTGSWMATYPSFSISSGNSARLSYNGSFNFASYGTSNIGVMFWMMHDTGYSGNADQVQVQISTDNVTWTNVGAPVLRYDATATSPTWKQHYVDASAYASSTTVWIAFLGVSYYGNNIFIDDAAIAKPVPIIDANPGDNILTKTITLSYEHDVGTLVITEPTVGQKDTRTYVHGPATNAWASTTGNIMGAIRLSPTELAGLDGYRLTAVQWGHNEDTTISGWVMVFDNGSTTGPGAVLANQSFTVTGPGEDQGNHTILLQNPVPVNVSRNLWIGVHVTAPYPAEYPMLATTPGIQTKTMWYSSNGGATWSDIYVPDTRNQSWQYKGIFSGPETTTFPPGTYPIAGIVHNYGVTYTESNFTVNAKVFKLGTPNVLVYQENVTVAGPLPPAVDAPVTFPDITIANVTASEGDYRLEITTMLVGDDHSNNDKQTKTFTIFIPDIIPPITTSTLTGTMGGGGWYRSNVTVTLTATDPAPPNRLATGKGPSGVNHTYYKIDSASTWTTYTIPFMVSPDGNHTVQYYSVDKVGNTETVKSVAFKIDKTPPTITLTATPKNLLKTKWLLNATVSDANSGVVRVEFYVDDGLVGNATAYPWSFLYHGTGQQAKAIVYDAAGNSKISEPVDQYIPDQYNPNEINGQSSSPVVLRNVQ